MVSRGYMYTTYDARDPGLRNRAGTYGAMSELERQVFVFFVALCVDVGCKSV